MLIRFRIALLLCARMSVRHMQIAHGEVTRLFIYLLLSHYVDIQQNFQSEGENLEFPSQHLTFSPYMAFVVVVTGKLSHVSHQPPLFVKRN